MQVVDADGHVTERESDVRVHMEEPYSRRGSLLPADEWDSDMYGTLGFKVYDVPTRLAAMDREGIEVSVLFPTRSFAVTQLPEKDYAAAYARGYNSWVASVCRESDRLRAVAIVPFQNVPAAVAEVNRAITQLGLVGVVVSGLGLQEHLGSQTYWPIYEAIERARVPLLIHNRRQTPFADHRYDTFLLAHTVGRPVETLVDCAALMYGGVPEKFPNLRIAFLEIGVGWVPYWMDRMDEEYEKRGAAEAPLLKAKPSEYMTSGKWYYATEPEESTLPYALDRLGEDVTVFASDYPHWDGMFPYVVATIRGRTDISEQAKEKILGGNATALYGW